jgi:hypothetical protein
LVKGDDLENALLVGSIYTTDRYAELRQYNHLLYSTQISPHESTYGIPGLRYCNSSDSHTSVLLSDYTISL